MRADLVRYLQASILFVVIVMLTSPAVADPSLSGYMLTEKEKKQFMELDMASRRMTACVVDLAQKMQRPGYPALVNTELHSDAARTARLVEAAMFKECRRENDVLEELLSTTSRPALARVLSVEIALSLSGHVWRHFLRSGTISYDERTKGCATPPIHRRANCSDLW